MNESESEMSWDASATAPACECGCGAAVLFWPVKTFLTLSIHELCTCAVREINR